MNYNTIDLISGLIFSLHRVIPEGSIESILVVDNRSEDGSPALLGALAGDGLIELGTNPGPPHHGPALNAGMSHLMRARQAGRLRADYVLVLDSDVIVLRPDVIEAAVAHMHETACCLAGEYVFSGLATGGYAHPSANMLRPSCVWRRGVSPFRDHGEPGVLMQATLRRSRGLDAVAEFPFFRDDYLLHLGVGTLMRVGESGMTDNPLYEFATTTRSHHYQENPRGERIHQNFLRAFADEVGELTAENLAAACRRDSRIDPLALSQ